MTRDSSPAGTTQTWLGIMGPTQRAGSSSQSSSEQRCGSDCSARTWAAEGPPQAPSPPSASLQAFCPS